MEQEAQTALAEARGLGGDDALDAADTMQERAAELTAAGDLKGAADARAAEGLYRSYGKPQGLETAQGAAQDARRSSSQANGMKRGEPGRAQAHANAAGDHRQAAEAFRRIGDKDKQAKHESLAGKHGKTAARLFSPAGTR